MKMCTICCGTLEESKCTSCGWKEISRMNYAWLAVHMGLLSCTIAYINGSLV